MKKVISLFLVLIAILSLCSCGGEGKATVINHGKTFTLSYKELKAENEENHQRFYESYNNASISFVGSVKSIDSSPSWNKYTINFKEGWKLELDDSKRYVDLGSLREGIKLKVDSRITVDDFLSTWIIKSNSTVVKIVG